MRTEVHSNKTLVVEPRLSAFEVRIQLNSALCNPPSLDYLSQSLHTPQSTSYTQTHVAVTIQIQEPIENLSQDSRHQMLIDGSVSEARAMHQVAKLHARHNAGLGDFAFNISSTLSP